MQLSHASPVRSAVFNDPNLVSCAALAPVLAVADQVGLSRLADQHLSVPGGPGRHAGAKVSSVAAGLVAGADSIADLDLLRHGGMGGLFAGTRAPSTLGTFLRAFRFGHVRQLDAVASESSRAWPNGRHCCRGAPELAYLDVDDTVKATYGHAKQGTGYGDTGVKGLNALLAIVSTPAGAPVIVPPGSARGRLTPPAVRAGRSPTRW